MKIKLKNLFGFLFFPKVVAQVTGEISLPEIPVTRSLIEIWKNYTFFVGTSLSLICIAFFVIIYYYRKRRAKRKTTLAKKKTRNKKK